jgi:ABC-type uncharacterized transport system auxiliary subunit
MRNAKLIVPFGIAMLALGACHKEQQNAETNSIAIDEEVPTNQMSGNADIEALPPDESSTTPSNQLQSGYDNPDVNDLGNSANSA